MTSWYNEYMEKVIQFFSRYSIGKNTSVRELPDQNDPGLMRLSLESEINPEKLKKEIDESKSRQKNNTEP